MRDILNGQWYFKQAGTQDWMNAEVPGCNYLDLMKNSKIADPFYKTNERDVQWVSNEDWIYRKDFELSSSKVKHDRIYLCFDQIDTLADIFLNGEKIAYTDNCHVGCGFEVSKFLRVGKNTLEIYFYSPIKYVENKQKNIKCPRNNNGLTGIPHIRKPQCHFGWDWGPVLPSCGLGMDVYLEYFDTGRLTEVNITQSHKERVELTVNVKADNFNNANLKTHITLVTPDNNQKTEIIEQNSDIKAVFDIDNPMLWQPNGLTERIEQPLYLVKVELYREEKLLDAKTKKIGLRTIELNTAKDRFGSNFQFVVNGNPIFCKGANWIPADSFNTRVTDEKLEKYIEIARKSGFNMLRIWGGGYYGSDYFYELCDKYGIMVWQDFMFACQPYPFFDNEFLNNVNKEIEYNVKRLAHHASLALWCGNNEIEVMSPAWINRKDFVRWTEKYFYKILPEIVRQSDEITPYIPGTPLGSSHNKGVSSDKAGDTHLWAVWHGLQNLRYYRKRNTRFCSEFGFESLPDVKCIEKFADSCDYSLDSEVFTAHQKCNGGNKKMQFYIASDYRLPENFTDYIYLSNVCQAECVKDATEHWRRNGGRCNGSLYWQFNDCWPVCSWSGMDYYMNYKALQYETVKFFAPIIVSLKNEKKRIGVYVINDTLEAESFKLIIKLSDFTDGVIFEETIEGEIKGLRSKCIKEYRINDLKLSRDLKRTVFSADLTIDGKTVNSKTVLFDKEKNLDLKPAKIEFDIVKKDDAAEIWLKSDRYVRKLRLSSSLITEPFSDNYFDLLPKEEKTVCVKTGNVPIEKLKESLELFDVSRIKPAESKLKDWLKKTKIFLIPINFFSYVYYKWLI